MNELSVPRTAHPLHYGRTSVTLLKYDKIGLKIVALGLNLSPFCRRYENVIDLTLPITLVIGQGFWF